MALDNNTIVTIIYSDGSTEFRTVKRIRLLFAHETKEFQIAFFDTLERNGQVDIITAVYKIKKIEYNFAERLNLKKL